MSEEMHILLADDSAITRGLFSKAFIQSGFEIAGMVSNGRKAVDFCREHKVDAVVSDFDMPEMGGLEAAKIIVREFGIPVVMYAEQTDVKADVIATGATFEKKPPLSDFDGTAMKAFVERVRSVIEKSPSAGRTEFSAVRQPLEAASGAPGASGDSASEISSAAEGAFKVLCIGASTGGPTAVQEVLSGLGPSFPLPVLYVQHIDVGADEKMVRWFNQVCPNMPMHLASNGEVAQPGHVYMAPAEKHLVIDYTMRGLPVLSLSDEPPERFLRPAVNKLFRSAAKLYKSACLAVLMTGMGQDGAEGCKEIVAAGGTTIVEDKSTCTVFGMPAAAIELGAATKVLPRTVIAAAVRKLVK